MSIEPANAIVVSAAGSHLAQNVGPDAIRARQAAAMRQCDWIARAHAAVGQPDTLNLHADRDPDGRRTWQRSPSLDEKGEVDAVSPTAHLRDEKQSASEQGIDVFA